MAVADDLSAVAEDASSAAVEANEAPSTAAAEYAYLAAAAEDE